MKKFLFAPIAAAVFAGSVVAANAAIIVPAQYTTGTVAATNEAAQTITIGRDVYYGVTGVDVGTEFARCRKWCAANSKKFSRQRFLNWIARSEPRIGRPSAIDPRKVATFTKTEALEWT